MSVVENIKLLCKENGTTVPKLGTELGFGNGAIYNWDKNSPSIDKLQKVADHFRVSIERILYGFDLSGFEGFIRILVGQKTIGDVAKTIGVDAEILEDYLIGIRTTRPDIDFVEKLAAYNPYEVLFRREDLLKAAGYDAVLSEALDHLGVKTEDAIPGWATSKDIRDFKRMLEEDAPVMFDGVPIEGEARQRVIDVLTGLFWEAKEMNKKTYGRKPKGKDELDDSRG